MTKFLNAILILIILIFGAKLVMRGQEYRTLAQERSELLEKLDGFRVRDSSKYLVQAVDTGDPMLFMWRVHKPGGLRTGYLKRIADRGANVFAFGGSWENKLERVSARFEFFGDELYVDMQTARGGHRTRVVDAELLAICQQHWEDLEIEVLGQEGAIEIDVNQEVVLLHIVVPDKLVTKLEAMFGKTSRFSKPKQSCYRFSFGKYGLIESIGDQLGGLR